MTENDIKEYLFVHMYLYKYPR